MAIARKNIYGFLDLFYYPFKLLGLAPITRIKNKKNEYIYIPQKMSVENIITLFVIVFISIGSFLVVFCAPTEKLSLSAKIEYTFAGYNHIVFIVAPIKFMYNKEKYLAFYKLMNEIDLKFKRLNLHFTYVWYSIITACLLVFGTISSILHSVIYNNSYHTHFEIHFNAAIQVCFYVNSLLPLYFYLSFHVMITLRIHFLNEILEKMTYEIHTRNYLIQRLELVAYLYYKLTKVAAVLEELASYTVLLNILGTFVIMVSSVISIFNNRINETEEIVFYLISHYTCTGIVVFCAEAMSHVVS